MKSVQRADKKLTLFGLPIGDAGVIRNLDVDLKSVCTCHHELDDTIWHADFPFAIRRLINELLCHGKHLNRLEGNFYNMHT